MNNKQIRMGKNRRFLLSLNDLLNAFHRNIPESEVKEIKRNLAGAYNSPDRDYQYNQGDIISKRIENLIK